MQFLDQWSSHQRLPLASSESIRQHALNKLTTEEVFLDEVQCVGFTAFPSQTGARNVGSDLLSRTKFLLKHLQASLLQQHYVEHVASEGRRSVHSVVR